MNNFSPLLNSSCEVMTRVTTQLPSGQVSEAWTVAISDVKCRKDMAPRAYSVKDDKYKSLEERYIFFVDSAYKTQITRSNRIQHEGIDYFIVDITNFDGFANLHHIEIYCIKVDLGGGAGMDAGGGSSSGGTVTSVALNMPAGFLVDGSPITEDGTFEVTLQEGYEIPQSSVLQNLKVDFLSGLVEAPANSVYLIAINIPYAITINSVTTKSISGSCTLDVSIDGVSLGGGSNTVSTTETTKNHSTLNSANVGTDIAFRISGNAGCTFLSFTIKYTRN